MRTRKLAIACPGCGSGEVYYTCNPNCCFNHVCGNCGTTFEPVTRVAGGRVQGILPPDPLPEAVDPTAACAVCESTAVYLSEDGSALCGACGAFLTLELTNVQPA